MIAVNLSNEFYAVLASNIIFHYGIIKHVLKIILLWKEKYECLPKDYWMNDGFKDSS